MNKRTQQIDQYANDMSVSCMCSEICGDDRFEVIENAKQKLLESTNVESSPDEMEVIDRFLFRMWQMGWLPKVNIITNGDNIRSMNDDELAKAITNYTIGVMAKAGMFTPKRFEDITKNWLKKKFMH